MKRITGGGEQENDNPPAMARDALAEVDVLRQRLAELEATLPKRAAGNAAARSRIRALAILAAGAVLGGTSIVYGQSAVEALFVSKDGYVGIGTPNPTSILDVAPPGGGTFYLRDNAGVAGTIKLRQSGGANHIESGLSTAPGSAASLLFTDMQASNIWMTITGTGNVGIGTTPAKQKLEVNGRIADKTGPVMPVGTIVAFAGATPPDGWLICDGRPLPSDAVYAELRGVLGATLPDLRGRTLIGSGTSASGANYSLKDMPGEEKHTLTVDEMPKHHHSGFGANDKSWPFGVDLAFFMGSAAGINNYNFLFRTTDTGGNQPFNNMQPSYVVSYIIKY